MKKKPVRTWPIHPVVYSGFLNYSPKKKRNPNPLKILLIVLRKTIHTHIIFPKIMIVIDYTTHIGLISFQFAPKVFCVCGDSSLQISPKYWTSTFD
ncbi:hypothetical protein [Flavobacterium cheongpyeongense]|uniref:hypothetical protein n=1 Tax=Flavobacterium cheongpyeongense TaxID=2212651 RepID=UPI000F4F138E|nr:hypothetical protein [Flavobacterium cheongpyeongense]